MENCEVNIFQNFRRENENPVAVNPFHFHDKLDIYINK